MEIALMCEQAKAAEAAAKLAAELKSAELLKHTAEANIAAMQKQVYYFLKLVILCANSIFAAVQRDGAPAAAESRRRRGEGGVVRRF